jgi:ribosomal protein S18 acetylase RimI-like enzyme
MMVCQEGNLIIRFFNKNDINQIAKLHSLYLNKNINDSDYKHNLMYHYYDTVLYHDDSICLVAVRQNELIGCILLRKSNHNDFFNAFIQYPIKFLHNIFKIAVFQNKHILNILYKVILSTIKGLLPSNNSNVISYTDYYQINPIIVKEDYWGTNVATYLLLEAEKILITMKERKLYLYVNPDNKRAIKFYEKMNFKIVNDIIDNKMITMEKIIANDGL